MKVETFELRDWEEPETGLVLAENEDWVLLRYVYADYMVDGWKLIRKSMIQERESGEDEAQIERVLRLKGEKGEVPAGFSLGSEMEMISWIADQYGFVEIQDEEEEIAFAIVLGEDEGEGELLFDMILADGEVEPDCVLPFKEICIISFDGDYFRSVGLLWKDQNPN
jgi:hypothetical protein